MPFSRRASSFTGGLSPKLFSSLEKVRHVLEVTHVFRVFRLVNVIMLKWILPVRLLQKFPGERRRHRSYICEFLKEKYGPEAGRHTPSETDVLMFTISAHSRDFLRLCSTWIISQFLLAAVQQIRCNMLVTSCLASVDTLLLLCLFAIAVSNVARYGPTCAAFVVSLRLKDPTGSKYRMALDSYPRKADDDEEQLEHWMYTRLYVRLLAKAEARERLLNIGVAFAIIVLCISVISYLVSCFWPLIMYNQKPVTVHDGIWRHLHFYLVTFSTIGYGDMTFDNSKRGHIVGSIMSIIVMSTVLGFVSYIGYYITNFKERLFAGLDLEVGSSPEWTQKSLRDI